MLTDEPATYLGPFLTNSFGDTYLYEVNRNTFNEFGSATLYQNHYKDSFLEPDQLNIIIGTDSGLLLDYLANSQLPEGSRYVFVEISEVISRLAADNRLENLPEQLILLCEDEFWRNSEKFQFENYVYADKVFLHEAFCTLNSYLPVYRELAFNLKVELENKTWHTAAMVGKAPFILTQFKNLCEHRFDATILKDHFKGKTAVLLGGGPSLDKLLPWLRCNLDNVVILAVSRICKQLLAAKITPHFIFSVDPYNISFDVSQEMSQFADRSIFICANHVSPLLLSQWPGRSIYLGPLFPYDSSLNSNNFGSEGPTVTNAALLTAVHMGFEQVVFSVVDFFFDPKGFTHANGSIENLAGPKLGNTITVTTNDGDTAESSPDFVVGMNSMSTHAAYALQHGCKVINPAGQAAHMENIVYTPANMIELTPVENNPVEEVLALLPPDDQVLRTTHYQNVLKELRRIKYQLRKISNLAKEALACNNGLFGRKGKKRDFKYKLRMDKIEKQLVRDFADLYPLVKQNSARSFLKIVPPDSEKEWTDKEVERVGRDYYQTCRESVKDLSQLVNDSISLVEMRLEEEADKPDLALLVNYWRNKNQLGRVRVWVRQNQEKFNALDEVDKDFLEAVDREFETSLRENQTLHINKKKEKLGLHSVIGGALQYFKAGDAQGLIRLQEGLIQHPDKEKSKLLLHFVNGLQYELSNNLNLALKQYHMLIGDTQDFLTEDTLLRILHISLEQIDLNNAKLAAECLTGLSFTYLPHYAKIIGLSGDKANALEIYTDYLEKVGYDMSVMLKMGLLYKDLGIIEGSKLMYTTILEKEPENQTALKLLSDLDQK